ncbi:MAG: hypothetical protein KKB59_14145 [Spirochaetes bacterium]|nr:hypothetical protein [Spirochaetota bacterium]
MGVLDATKMLTLTEITKRAGYDGEANVLGAIAQQLDILDEIPWYPATHKDYNRQFQAKRLGSGGFTKVNGPIVSASSEGDYIPEPVKMYATESKVDEKALAGLTGEEAYRVRDSEDAMNLTGIMQDWAKQLMYADQGSAPDAFKGFASRRASLSAPFTTGASGTGSDLTSVWTFEFTPAGVYLVYQKGGQPGIKNEDRGRWRIRTPADDGDLWAWIRYYEIWAGIVCRNERAMNRYCNIETAGSSNLFDPSVYLAKVKNQLPSRGKNAVSFANRTILGQIEANAYNKTNAAYNLREIVGFGPVAAVGGIPFRCWESILDTETALT